MTSKELDQAIEQYLNALADSKAMNDADLAEIEDHLRSSIDDLIAVGRGWNEAFISATERLGQPLQLAKEYARRRSLFGPRLPKIRSISAALFSVPGLFLAARWYGDDISRLLSVHGAAFSANVALSVLLVLGQSWVRAIMLGSLLFALPAWTFWLQSATLFDQALLNLTFCLGSCAFLLPWRKNEMNSAGWALVGLGFSAATVIENIGFSRAMGDSLHILTAAVSLAAFLAGFVGLLRRSTWAYVALAIAGVGILHNGLPSYANSKWYTLTALASGSALFMAAWLSRKSDLRDKWNRRKASITTIA